MLGAGGWRASTAEPRINAALAADKRALTEAQRHGVKTGQTDVAGTAMARAIGPEDVEREMMFLMIQALRASPCQEAARKLEEEANAMGVFGSVTDWNGTTRPRTFDDARRRNVQVGSSHLQRLALIGAESWRDRAQPGHLSLPCTLLRNPSQLTNGAVSSMVSAAILQRTRVPLRGATNEILSLRAREQGAGRNQKWRPQIYQRIEYQASVMGHFCPVYCLAFDRTGLRFITGSDDKLIKIWISRSGILLRTLRGHVSDIVDISVSCDNRFLASCSNDQDVRIWWLHNGVPLAVLPGHTNLINNVIWSSTLNMDLSQNLYSWGQDGTLRTWRIDAFGSYTGCQVLVSADNAPTAGPSAAGVARNNAPASVNCATFDPLGRWVAIGCADNLIRIYWLNAPHIRPTRWSGHAGGVEHILTNKKGDLVVSGSADGSVRLWPLVAGASDGRPSWPLQVDYQRARVINIRTGEQTSTNRNVAEKHHLNMVVLTQDCKRIVTSQNLEKKRRDGGWVVRIKVWDVETGELAHSFNNQHELPVHVLECHPTEANLVASAGYDAKVFFWDVLRGECVAKFQITFKLDDRLNPVSFDENSSDILEGKWHPDGTCFMTTHKNGFTSFMSVRNHADSFRKTPREQFFQVDFGDLVMDQQRNVIDLAAQVPPHTMSSGYLCDRFGQCLEIASLVGQDMLPSHPLLVSPPRVSRPHASDMEMDGMAADAEMAAEMQEEAYDEADANSDDEDDEDFTEEADDDDDNYAGDTREERRAQKRHELKQKKPQSDRERRATAFAERRFSKRAWRSTREDDDDVSEYSEDDLSESELFVVPRGPKKREGGRREDKSGWQPEQQRKRVLTQVELHKNINRCRKWLMGTRPPQNVDEGYVPQIGDAVVYFHQGHQEQLCDYPEAQCQRAQQPWEEFKLLKPAEKCEVVDIKYQIPATNEPEDNSVYCILLLKRLPDDLQGPKPGRKFANGQPVKARWKEGHRFNGRVVECNDDGTYVVHFDDGDREPAEPEDRMDFQTFPVSCRKTNHAEFVLPIYRYERHERNVFGPGDRFKMFFDDSPELFHGTITGMTPFHAMDYPDSPWQCLDVRWDSKGGDKGETDKVSPWEIMPVAEEPVLPALSSNLSDTECKRLEIALAESVVVTDVARPFVAQLPEGMLAYVPLPLNLELVIARLRNGYYRSAEQVKHDLNVICRGCSLAPQQDEMLLNRASVLDEILNAVLAGKDIAEALAKWDVQAASAVASGSKDGWPVIAGGGGSGASGPSSSFSSRIVVTKVSPETVWKQGARAAVEAFDTDYGEALKSWTSAASLQSPSAVQEMVEAWQCCEYESMVGKVATGEYGGLNGANTLGYDLLSLCCKALLLLAPGSEESKKARNVLARALAIWFELKSSHPQSAAQTAPPRSGRRSAESDNGNKTHLETLVALDTQGLLEEIASPVLSEKMEAGGGGNDTKLRVKGLRDMVALAERYRSPEEVGVDLLALCASAMLHCEEETQPLYVASSSVVAKGMILFPKPKAISLRISLGRSADHRATATNNSGGVSRPAGQHVDSAVEESDKGKGRADNDRDRTARVAMRQSSHMKQETAAVHCGERSSAASGEGASGRRPAASASTGTDDLTRLPAGGTMEAGGARAGATCIDIQGTREWLKKCIMKLRSADSLGIFEDAVTDDVAPGYSKVITNPMCFAQMQQDLEHGGYDTLPQVFVADVLLIVANALTFNEPGGTVSDLALTLAKRALNLFADKLPEWNALLESTSAVEGAESAYAPLLARLKSVRALDHTHLFQKRVCDRDVQGYSSVIKLPMDLSSIEDAIRAGRYGDERLMQLDVMLIGVNCCIFNGPETPYYPIAIKFLKGALKVKRKTAAGAAGARASKKSRVDAASTRHLARGHELHSSSYFDEETLADSSGSRAPRTSRREPVVVSGGMDTGEEAGEDEEEEDDEEDEEEEFVPTNRKSAPKSQKKRGRSRRGADESDGNDSDQPWGGGADSPDDDDEKPTSRSTRANRAGARASSSGGRKQASAGRSSKRRRLAIGSDSDESEAEASDTVSQDEDSD